jgi:Spy/CpxP family protein refolding chaperone
MKRLTLALIAALTLSACSSDTTAPGAGLTIDESATALILNGGYDAVLYEDRLINALPPELRLSAEQRARIRALVEAFQAIPKSDRRRFAEAQRKLVADINAVLTPEQRAWIHDHRPQRCRPDMFPPLTDAQKAQIHSLEQAFRQQNRVYLDSLSSILDEARAAAVAGKSRSEIAAILAKAVPVAGVLATARAALLEDIRKVLTPAQLASGCLPLG